MTTTKATETCRYWVVAPEGGPRVWIEGAGSRRRTGESNEADARLLARRLSAALAQKYVALMVEDDGVTQREVTCA